MANFISHRRPLKFSNLLEVEADVQTLLKADLAGSIKQLGNWPLGQTLNHLASWVDYSFEGVPMSIPFVVRLIMRPMKNRMLYKPMRDGLRIPRVPGGTFGIEPLSTAAGYSHFQKAFQRLSTEAPAIPHMFFGRLTRDEWIALHLRHAELHLSLLIASGK